MEPWQLAAVAAAGGALLLASRGGGGAPDLTSGMTEDQRESFYGLPDAPLAVAGDIYGLSEEEIADQLDEFAERLAPALLGAVTPQRIEALRRQLETISGLVARVYGPDNAYFPAPSNVTPFAGPAPFNVLNEILLAISRESYHRQRMYQEGVSFVPAAIESVYTTGALEAEWVGYMRTLRDFLRGNVTQAYRLPEQLYLAPGVGQNWPLVEPYVTRVEGNAIYVGAPNYIGLMRSVGGPWSLSPEDSPEGIARAGSLIANLCAIAGERDMAQSAQGLSDGWYVTRGAAREVLVRKLTNAVVPLLRTLSESGETIWHFTCDTRTGGCPG